jgi:hypothetical protein
MRTDHGRVRFALTIRRAAWLTMVAIGCVGCERDVYLEVRSIVAWDDVMDSAVVIEVPDTFEVGVPATVRFNSYSSACDRAAPTPVEITGLVAVIQPYDSVLTWSSTWACRREPVSLLPHAVPIEFRESGQATIKLTGIWRHYNWDLLWTYDTTVVVR